MFKATLTAIALLAALTASANAACPPATPGNTSAEIQANSQRLVCLQNELAQATAQKKTELELDQFGRTLNDLQLQRRLDALPKIPVYTPPAQQAF